MTPTGKDCFFFLTWTDRVCTLLPHMQCIYEGLPRQHVRFACWFFSSIVRGHKPRALSMRRGTQCSTCFALVWAVVACVRGERLGTAVLQVVQHVRRLLCSTNAQFQALQIKLMALCPCALAECPCPSSTVQLTLWHKA